KAALDHYAAARGIAEQLGQTGEAELSSVQRRRATALARIAEGGGDTSALREAREAIDAAIEIDKRLLKADPTAPDRQRDLTASLRRSAQIANQEKNNARAAQDEAELRTIGN